jgi:ABC-type lipoprotein export system ATPase subunit
MSPVISVRDLTKTYKVGEHSVHALRSISLDIEQSEFVSVIGPSGSGKSTLMHILGCLDQPTSGLGAQAPGHGGTHCRRSGVPCRPPS